MGKNKWENPTKGKSTKIHSHTHTLICIYTIHMHTYVYNAKNYLNTTQRNMLI